MQEPPTAATATFTSDAKTMAQIHDNDTTSITETIQIFISHSTQDEAIADALTDFLKAALTIEPQAIRCTSVEGHKLPAGSRTTDQLKQELLDAKSFIALLTPHSLRSTWVLFELGARWGRGETPAPLLAAGLTAEQLAGPLTDINALSCDSETDLHSFAREIARVVQVQLRAAVYYTPKLNKLRDVSKAASIKQSEKQSETLSAAMRVPTARQPLRHSATFGEPEVKYLSIVGDGEHFDRWEIESEPTQVAGLLLPVHNDPRACFKNTS